MNASGNVQDFRQEGSVAWKGYSWNGYEHENQSRPGKPRNEWRGNGKIIKIFPLPPFHQYGYCWRIFGKDVYLFGVCLPVDQDCYRPFIRKLGYANEGENGIELCCAKLGIRYSSLSPPPWPFNSEATYIFIAERQGKELWNVVHIVYFMR